MRHGLTQYGKGCRCTTCKAAKRKSTQRFLSGESHREPSAASILPRPTGALATNCWCEKKTVFVSPADVRSGRTGSCGDVACTPPRGAA